MLLYEMLTGLPPWYTKDRKKLYESLKSAPLEFPNYVSARAQSLIAVRIPAVVCRLVVWLSGYDSPRLACRDYCNATLERGWGRRRMQRK